MPGESRRPRVDWRFLVGDAPARTALVMGGPESWRLRMRDALVAAGVETTPVTAFPPAPTADVVVLRADDDRAVHALSERVDLAIAIDVPRGSGWPRMGRPHTRLVAWPRAATTSELVPVAVPDARAAFIARRGRRGGWRSRLPRLLLTRPMSRTLDRLVLAQGTDAEPALVRLARSHAASMLTSHDAPWTLATPRFQTSGHVVLLLDDAVVVKVQRNPKATSVLREAAVLRAVDRHLGRETSFAPRLLATDAHGAHPLLVETAISGDPLTPGRAGPSAPAFAASIAASLRGLVTTVEPFDGSWRTAMVDESVRAIRASLVPDVLDAEAVDRLERSLDALTGCLLPAAIEHGDLADPNLFVDRAGRIGIIDWELGNPHGLALLDLAFVISYLADAEARASDADRAAEAWDSVALRPDGWGAKLLAREAAALGIGPQLVQPLILLAWTRQLAALLDRLPGTVDARRRIGSHRYVAVWRRTLEQAR